MALTLLKSVKQDKKIIGYICDDLVDKTICYLPISKIYLFAKCKNITNASYNGKGLIGINCNLSKLPSISKTDYLQQLANANTKIADTTVKTLSKTGIKKTAKSCDIAAINVLYFTNEDKPHYSCKIEVIGSYYKISLQALKTAFPSVTVDDFKNDHNTYCRCSSNNKEQLRNFIKKFIHKYDNNTNINCAISVNICTFGKSGAQATYLKAEQQYTQASKSRYNAEAFDLLHAIINSRV